MIAPLRMHPKGARTSPRFLNRPCEIKIPFKKILPPFVGWGTLDFTLFRGCGASRNQSEVRRVKSGRERGEGLRLFQNFSTIKTYEYCFCVLWKKNLGCYFFWIKCLIVCRSIDWIVKKRSGFSWDANERMQWLLILPMDNIFWPVDAEFFRYISSFG